MDPQTDEPVVTIRWPVNSGDGHLGLSGALHPRDSSIEDIRDFGVDHAEPNLVTFNQFGEVLTTDDASFTDVDPACRAHCDLVDLARDHGQANSRDEQPTRGAADLHRGGGDPGPGHMHWAAGRRARRRATGGSEQRCCFHGTTDVAGLGGVAYFAVHRLVIRHVREMRRMRRFASASDAEGDRRFLPRSNSSARPSTTSPAS